MPGPLAGITVVEAATYITGPLAARTLADLGAHVVKVEPPSGDAFRRVGRRVDGVGVMWAEANHGKGLVTTDLKDPAGLADFMARLENADVLVTNWRPGVADSLGSPGPWPSRPCWLRCIGATPPGEAWSSICRRSTPWPISTVSMCWQSTQYPNG